MVEALYIGAAIAGDSRQCKLLWPRLSPQLWHKRLQAFTSLMTLLRLCVPVPDRHDTALL